MVGPEMIEIVKIVAVLLAAALVGNWFLSEAKKARKQAKAWYAAYFSLPGLIVILAICLPLIIWILSR
jgi:hypothetical protein